MTYTSYSVLYWYLVRVSIFVRPLPLFLLLPVRIYQEKMIPHPLEFMQPCHGIGSRIRHGGGNYDRNNRSGRNALITYRNITRDFLLLLLVSIKAHCGCC